MNRKRPNAQYQQPDRRRAYDGVCEAIRSVARVLDRFDRLSANEVHTELSRIHRSLLATRYALPRPKTPKSPKKIDENNVKKVVFGSQSSHSIAGNVAPHAHVWLGTGQTRVPGSHRSS